MAEAEPETPSTEAEEGVTLKWNELLVSLTSCKDRVECFPTKELEDALLNKPLSERPITGLDFSGMDPLTDEICYMLCEIADKRPAMFRVTYLSFVGCVHLTDFGIQLLVERFFVFLKKIELDGCSLLTEKSLALIASYCWQVQFVSMAATAVSHLPTWITASKIQVDVSGCPLFPNETSGNGRIPAFFHNSHGRNVSLQSGNQHSTAINLSHAICFSNRPLHLKDEIALEFEKVAGKHLTHIGLTIANPASFVAMQLPNHASPQNDYVTAVVKEMSTLETGATLKMVLKLCGGKMTYTIDSGEEQCLVDISDTAEGPYWLVVDGSGNSVKIEDSHGGDDTDTKVVVLSAEGCRHNMCDFLKGRTDGISSTALSFNGDEDFSFMKNKVNVFECHTQKCLASLVMSPGAIYLISFELEDLDEFRADRYIMQRWSAIKAISEHSEVSIVVFFDPSKTEEVSREEMLEKISASFIKAYASMQDNAIKSHLEMDKYNNKASVSRDFQTQQSYMRLLKAYNNRAHNTFHIYGINIKSKEVKQYYPHSAADFERDIDKLKIDQLSREVLVLERRSQSLLSDANHEITKICAIEEKIFKEVFPIDNPSDAVVHVGEAIAILTGNKQAVEEGWRGIYKTCLENGQVLKEITEIYKLDLSSTNMKLLEPYEDKAKKDKDAHPVVHKIWDWIRSMYRYAITHKRDLDKYTKELETYTKTLRQGPGEDELKKKIEDALAEFMPMFSEAQNAVRNINKRDITELKSYAKPPSLVQKVGEAFAIITGNQSAIAKGWKKIVVTCLSNMDLIYKMSQDLDQPDLSSKNLEKLRPYMEDPDMTLENAKRMSLAAAGIWQWIECMYTYGTIYNPQITMFKKMMDQTQETLADNEVGPRLILYNLRHAKDKLTSFMYHSHVGSGAVPAVDDMYKAVMSHFNDKIIHKEDLFDKNSSFPTLADPRLLTGALIQLNDMGKLLFYADSPGQPIVMDIPWYMDILNNLQLQKDLADNNLCEGVIRNGTSCTAIPPHTPIFTKHAIQNIMKSPIGSEKLVEKLCCLLSHFGILALLPQKLCQFGSECQQFVFFPHLEDMPYIWNFIDNEGKPDMEHFLTHYWPPLPSTDTEAEVVLAYRMTLALPADLVPRLLAECCRIAHASLVWQHGVVLRCGAAEMLVEHTFIETMMSDGLEVSARVSKLSAETSDHVLQSYLWSAISPVLSVLHGILVDYPILSWRMKVPCQGSCLAHGGKNQFILSHLPRQHDAVFPCEKCSTPMKPSKSGFLTGRQMCLPFHHFRDSEEQRVPFSKLSPYAAVWKPFSDGGADAPMWVCIHCGISNTATEHLWKKQCKAWPGFAAYGYSPPTVKGKHHGTEKGELHGCLLTAPTWTTKGKQSDHVMTVKCNRPLQTYGVGDLNITILEPGNIKVVVGSMDYYKRLFKDDVSLKRSSVGLNLGTGECVMGDFLDEKKATVEEAPEFLCKRGDRVSVHTTKEKLVKEDRGTMPLLTTIQILKNGVKLREIIVRPSSNATIILEATEDNQPQILLGNPYIPMVSSNHFHLGSALLYKNKIGNSWKVGRVLESCGGQLRVGDSGEEGQEPRWFQPYSIDLLPLDYYADGLTVICNNETLKSIRQLHDYLSSTESLPAPIGLFQDRMRDEHIPPPLFLSAHEARFCCFSSYSPQAIDLGNLTKFVGRKTFSLLGQPTKMDEPLVLLPRDLSDMHTLLCAPRSRLQSWGDLRAAIVCQGLKGGRHLMNEATCDVDEADVRQIILKFSLRVMATYRTLLGKQYILPQTWDNLFPEISSDIPHHLLLRSIQEMMCVYSYTLQLAEILQELLPNGAVLPKSSRDKKNPDKLMSIAHTMKFSTKPCDTHYLAGKVLRDKQMKVKKLNSLKEEPVGDYADCVTTLSFNMSIPTQNVAQQAQRDSSMFAFIKNFSNLVVLDIQGLTSLVSISECINLEVLNITDCTARSFPDEMRVLKRKLEALSITNAPIEALPDWITEFTNLKMLHLKNTLLERLPEDIGNMTNLRNLKIIVSLVDKLPESLGDLKYLEELRVNGVPWRMLGSHLEAGALVSFQQLMRLVKNQNKILAYQSRMTDTDWKELFMECDIDDVRGINAEEANSLNYRLFDKFPRIGKEGGGFPCQILRCRILRILSLRDQAFHSVPNEMSGLSRLAQIHLGDNPKLDDLGTGLGLPCLRELELSVCESLRTPPQEIIAQGYRAVVAYMKRLSQGSVPSYRCKLMFVGLGAAGKTSLIRSLMSKDHKAPAIKGEGITDGIDIGTWSISKSKQTLTYSIWDFAGQTLYYNTHQFFLSDRRTVYILVWNTRLGYEHSGLDFWLGSLACHCPDSPVFIVGTHADQITNPEVPEQELRRKYNKTQFKGFLCVSSLTGQGVSTFLDQLLTVTLQQPHIGEMIPECWLNFEHSILNARKTGNLIHYTEATRLAINAGIHSTEKKHALRFLHDMGIIQFFDNELLRDQVVINPQWIVDVMACVVTVHNKIVKNGRLKHSDIGKLWKDYPAALHNWLLHLTEVFDLTFPLQDKPENIVPCLLPQAEPQYDWTVASPDEGIVETKMIYKFDYLPAGLFNRVQVRLYEFSDNSALWKTGSILKKNGHIALLKQISEQDVLVKAVGPRPENMILLVHEIFEALKQETYHGVNYVYHIPCMDCISAGSTDPAMFSSSVLRRAIDLKAFFIQCHSFFHTLSLTDIQGSIPPQSGVDYDIQLVNAMRELQDLEQEVGTDVFVLYCKKNLPSPEERDTIVDPAKIAADLISNKITCWFAEDLHDRRPSDIYLKARTSKVVLVLMSDEFVKDEFCDRLFHHVYEDLKKDIVILMVGRHREWMKSPLASTFTGQVFINFQRMQHYDSKIKELLSRLEEKLRHNQTSNLTRPACDVFLSYCWMNSKIAVDLGQAKAKDGSLGLGDPRQVKQFLESEGLSCWMDIEQVGRQGLYEDIADGIRHCKVVVACISDEYATSASCKMEFRFAHVALGKPIVIVVVGSGYKWQSTEIGMLSLGYDKVNFQAPPTPAEYTELLTHVRQLELEARPTTPSLGITAHSNAKEKAFQELFEMAQRKFLSQLKGFCGKLEPYPHLFVVDLNYEPAELISTEGDGDTVGSTPSEGEQLSDNEQSNMQTFKNLLSGQFCIKVLCEYEKGWHAPYPGCTVELEGDDLVALWELAAPYMARIFSILQRSDVNLHMVRTQEGRNLQGVLQKRAGDVLHQDMRPVYLLLRKFVINKDTTNCKSTLKRCYFPNGACLWLCPEHQKLPRVSVLEDLDDAEGHVEDEALGNRAEVELLMGLRQAAEERRRQTLPTNIDNESKKFKPARTKPTEAKVNTPRVKNTTTKPTPDAVLPGHTAPTKAAPSPSPSQTATPTSPSPASHSLSQSQRASLTKKLSLQNMSGSSGQTSQACVII